jgi:hypothetical protein
VLGTWFDKFYPIFFFMFLVAKIRKMENKFSFFLLNCWFCTSQNESDWEAMQIVWPYSTERFMELFFLFVLCERRKFLFWLWIIWSVNKLDSLRQTDFFLSLCFIHKMMRKHACRPNLTNQELATCWMWVKNEILKSDGLDLGL